MAYNEESQLFALGTKIAFQCYASSEHEQYLRGYIYNAFKRDDKLYVEIAAEYLGRVDKYHGGGGPIRPYNSKTFQPVDLAKLLNYQYLLSDLLLLEPIIIGSLDDDFTIEELLLDPSPAARLLASVKKSKKDA